MDKLPLNCSALEMEQLCNGVEQIWINPMRKEKGTYYLLLGQSAIADAQERLLWFAPFVRKKFPEVSTGVIESALVKIPTMKASLDRVHKTTIPGCVLLKKDSDLPIAGSIKARGGIYEILQYAEQLAVTHGLLSVQDNYEKLASEGLIVTSNYFVAENGVTRRSRRFS